MKLTKRSIVITIIILLVAAVITALLFTSNTSNKGVTQPYTEQPPKLFHEAREKISAVKYDNQFRCGLTNANEPCTYDNEQTAQQKCLNTDNCGGYVWFRDEYGNLQYTLMSNMNFSDGVYTSAGGFTGCIKN